MQKLSEDNIKQVFTNISPQLPVIAVNVCEQILVVSFQAVVYSQIKSIKLLV